MAGTEQKRAYEVQIKGANSVKELKQEISNLRDKLVQLDDSTEEYSKTVGYLIEGEKKLKDVMSAGKAQLEGATGSYNAYVKEMSALKKVWREVTSEAERARIGARISEINEELKRMDSTIGNSQRKVGSYEEAIKKALMTPQQELKKLKKELAGMEQGTAEYNATFKRMAELTHDITEQQEMLRWSSADLGDILSNLTGVAQGVAGGLSAISAISGLISDGNEDVEKAMLTTQRWLQVIQGLGALEELGDRISGLWKGIKNYNTTVSGSATILSDFETNARGAAGATHTLGGNLNAVQGAAQGATVSIEEAAAAMSDFDMAVASGDVSLGDLQKYINQQIDGLATYARELSNTTGEHIKFQGSAGDMMVAFDDMANVAGNFTEEEKKLATTNTRLLKTNLQLKDTLQTTHKWQLLTRTATKAQIKENEALIVGNTLLATSFKVVAVAANVLKTAIISTGIGALLVLIGSLISSFMDWVSGSKKAEERTNALKDSTEKLNESLEVQDKAWERQEKMMQAQGASYEELYEAEKKHLQAKLAEVQASLATAQAMAKEIGQRRLQKAKYDEFRQSLEDLIEQEKELKIALEDLDWDKQVEKEKAKTKAIEEQKKAEEERKKALEEAHKARMKQIENERKEAEKLYNELKNFYKSDSTKLKEKYREDLKTLDKLNVGADEKIKAKQLLRQKYLYDLNKLNMDSVKALYDENRKYAQRAMEVYGSDTEEYIQKQIEEAERFMGAIQGTLHNIERGNDASKEFKFLNASEGTEIRNIEDANVELQIANRNIEELYKQLLELQTSKVVNKLNKDLEALGNEANNAFNKHDLSFELQASTSFNGFYSGLSPEQQKAELDARYNLQAEYLQRELDLYMSAIAQKNLTDEERVKLQSSINMVQMAQQDLVTQHTIDSNYLIIDSYDNMANSIQGIAGSITDILGSVGDSIMETAEAQLEAGEITEEEYNRQFEKNKSIQIAVATINTIAGALGAFMGITKDTGGWGIALAIAQATAVFTAGMLQIQKIKNTKPNSSSGGANSRYAEVVPNQTSDFNPALTQNVTNGQETENLANAMKGVNLWVSVTDIDNAQKQGKVRVAESSF